MSQRCNLFALDSQTGLTVVKRSNLWPGYCSKPIVDDDDDDDETEL